MPRSVPGPSRPAESPARQASGPSRRQLEIPEQPRPAESPARQASGPSQRQLEIPERSRPAGSQVGQAPTPSRPRTSTESSYKPTEHTREGRGEGSVEVTRPQVQRSLVQSPSAASRADDSERVIAALRQEDEQGEASCSAHHEGWAESPSVKEKAVSSAETSATLREMRRKDGRPDKKVDEPRKEPRNKSSLPPTMPRKKVRRGEQGAVWKALDLISSSPFTDEIESAELPERFTAPRLETYNGRTDPVAHIDHYHHRMALWRYRDPLMCRIFPSSLGEVALRWFNQLERGSIGSWSQMAEVFVGRFITNSRRSRGLDTLMVIRLGTNESLKDYSARFWETYNDIDACAEDTALQAFKLGLPPTTGLRQSLTKRPPTTLKKLMDRVERPPARTTQAPKARSAPTSYAAPSYKAFHTVFKEPIHRLLDKIKDKGHVTENCHKYKTLLEQLVAAGHLSDYVESTPTASKARGAGINRSGTQGPAPAGVIHVIHNPLCISVLPTSFRSDMQKASHLRRSYGIVDYAHFVSTSCSGVPISSAHQVVSFSDEDLADVQMPHNDPLVITLRFGDYDVQRVLVDQGESTIPMGKTTLPILAGPISLQTEFIVVRGTSPYNAIVGRDWLHRMKAVPSTLHQKLRFPTEEGVMEINGDQAPAAVTEKLAAEKDPEKVYFDPSEPEFYFLIGTNLSVDDRQGLVTLLMGFRDIFAWSVYEAPGNAGATYQRMVTGMFGHLIGNTVEAYIDDMLIKSKKKTSHVEDLREVLEILRATKLRLNATKCLFGVSSGKFLGHMISYNGVEANPDQISALLNLQPPKDAKQVQRLTGMIAALGRFISRSADRCRPFFQLLGKRRKFLWDQDSVSEHAVSAVLVRETNEGQRPVFFVSKTMDETESRYLPLEKAALALIQAAKKLPHYFQANTVTVLTDLPLKMLMHSSDFSGRITRWGVHLGSLGVEYKPRTSIKGQVLADFVAEFQGKEANTESNYTPSPCVIGDSSEWKLFVDGASNMKGAGAGAVLVSPEGLILEQAVRLGFLASNNEAEYEALLIGLRSALRLGADRLQVEQVRREYNSHADILAKLATALEADLHRSVTVEVLSAPSTLIDTVDRVCGTNMEPSWMDPLIAYLRDNCLPQDPKAANVIKRKAPSLVDDLLYEIHEGICGSHTGGRSLAHPSNVPRFAPKIHQPARELNPLSSPWPFAQWGLDIVGPLPRAPGNKKFLIVATDYFTKWVEAEPLSHIREVDTKRFLWKSIITRFGIPWAVISDNGTQFEGKLFKGFCSELGIRNFFSSPGYPQSNGQAEVSNKVILDGIKKRLEEAKGRWVEELPSVMWTHRTTKRRSTGETPFALAYGVEAVIPLEVGLPTTRTTEFDVEENESSLRMDLNLVEERRDMARIKLASYQHQMKRGYDKNIRPRSFQVGDLVLRKVVANTRNPNDGKLGPNWEGPYRVTSFAGVGAYRLTDLDGKSVLRPWNICNLKKYFLLSWNFIRAKKYVVDAIPEQII
uniref:Integrase catalytic domain-containing protein n=1 Tax=Fagus sylvatica TaxID=28930 RepID=A0A2N9GCT6_FAGSY